MVAAPVALLMHPLPHALSAESLHATIGTLSRIGAFSGVLVLSVIGVIWLRFRFFARPPARNATWGCGYDAPNPRMQYTAASFSTDFAERFKNVMVLLKRQRAPVGYFPSDSYVITDCVDAVERRLYSVIGHGDETASEVSRKMQEDDPRLAFSAGLAALVAIAALVLLAEGALP
jgi:hydrogenase-4 component B